MITALGSALCGTGRRSPGVGVLTIAGRPGGVGGTAADSAGVGAGIHPTLIGVASGITILITGMAGTVGDMAAPARGPTREQMCTGIRAGGRTAAHLSGVTISTVMDGLIIREPAGCKRGNMRQYKMRAAQRGNGALPIGTECSEIPRHEVMAGGMRTTRAPRHGPAIRAAHISAIRLGIGTEGTTRRAAARLTLTAEPVQAGLRMVTGAVVFMESGADMAEAAEDMEAGVVAAVMGDVNQWTKVPNVKPMVLNCRTVKIRSGTLSCFGFVVELSRFEGTDVAQMNNLTYNSLCRTMTNRCFKVEIIPHAKAQA
jgi:hypothetical protein